jgi:enoyl-CoA hydratase/carnithine racemase
MDQVRLEFRGKLAILALANPDGNRMNTAVLNGLRSALPQIRTAGATALLAIGDGSVFSYGADVAEMLTQPPEKALPIVADYMAVIAEIEAMPIPTIAAVHGVCSSGGLEFALAFDQLWAAAGTKIGFLEPLIFIPPLAGGVQRIAARAGRSRALEVTTAGRLYEVEEFERWNIVNRVLPADTLRSEAETFAAKAAAGPTRAIEAVKIILRVWESGGIEAADRITLSTVAGPFDSPEAKAAIRAYLARVREK